MRERMLFLSIQNQQIQDLKSDTRTGSILSFLLEKYDIDLLIYGNASTEFIAECGPALVVHKIDPLVASRRAMLNPLYKTGNSSNPSSVDKVIREKLKALCSANNYRRVFVSHNPPRRFIEWIRRMLPEASLITDTYLIDSESYTAKTSLWSIKNGISKPYYKLKAVLTRRDRQKLMSRTDLLLVSSEWNALSFKAVSFANARKVHTVPNFIDLKQPRYHYDTAAVKENWIVLHWNMSTFQGKNAALSFYKKIYPLIKAKFPDVQCHILGREVHPMIASLQKEDDSLVIHNDTENSAAYIQRAKVVITSMYEGCQAGSSILESWALRTPVVSSTKGSEGLKCEHNRNILLADTAADLANHVENLLQNKELNAIMAERAHQTLLKHYEAGKIKNKLLSLV